MNESSDLGTRALKTRNQQRIWFLLIVTILAVILGTYLGYQQSLKPETTIVDKIETTPLLLGFIITFCLIGLLIYNWIRFDEFERPRYDRSSSFALFASLLIVPWHLASTKGMVPPLNPLTCVFLFFAAKAIIHNLQKIIK